MTAIRYNNAATNLNAEHLIATIKSPGTVSVTLFASLPTAEHPSYNIRSDGPDTNLPLVAALAEIQLPGFDPLYCVYDGLFLTAARRTRFHEVVQVMDAAQASDKVRFHPQHIRFTSSLSPSDAANVMLAAQAQHVVNFTALTRAQYFALIVPTMTEAQYEQSTR